MNIIIYAGMIERKLWSKIEPITKIKFIKKIYLIRKEEFKNSKIKCYFPSGIWNKTALLKNLYCLFKIIQIVNKQDITYLIGIGLIPHGIIINIIGKIFNIKKINLLMGKNDLFLTFPTKKTIQKILFKILYMADIIGTRGTNSKKWLIKQGINSKKIFIPHNIFNFKDFYIKKNLLKEYDLIYVGLFKKYKRLDLLLEILKRLVYDYKLKNIKLLLVGNGPMYKELKIIIKKYDIEKNVQFKNSENVKYLNDLYNKSKLFIMTSHGEGLPMVLVEALSCGLPVLAFNDADISDIVIEGKNGLLCEINNLDKFSKNIYKLLKEKKYLKEMQSNTKMFKKEKKMQYNLNYNIKLWEKILK